MRRSMRMLFAVGLAAVMCARGGLTILEISELLGHSSIVPTARYTKFIPQDAHTRRTVKLAGESYGIVTNMLS
jgi:hypothetical protein